ncbi:MAG: carboxypeptidase regulatory-like domain-containing protein [Polyangiaceae bacterium]
MTRTTPKRDDAVEHARPRAVAIVLGVLARGLGVVLALIVCGGIPASSLLRTVVFERSAPPLPEREEGVERDAALIVSARTPEGAPIASARVRVLALRTEGEGQRAYAAGEARTVANGTARLDRLPRGETWVTAEAEGRARGSTSLVLEKGDRSVEIVLAVQHLLDVEVRDERGAPVAAAEVEVAEADPLPVGARAGDNGIAHVTRLGAPPWAVTARATGFDEVTTRGVRDGPPLRLVLHKLGAIAVHVVDERGDGVPHARVGIASPALWPARVADCDASGGVRIGALPAGTYALRATAGDRATAIELGAALARGEEKGITLRLVPSEMVAIRVTGDEPAARGGADDAPVAGARVTLAESGVSPFPIEATTDRDGRARLGPIARGPASIAVRAEGYVARSLGAPDPLPNEVPVVLARAGAVAGRVTDARGFPVDGATIELLGTAFDGEPIDDDPRRARFTDAEFVSALAGPRPLVPAGELGVMPGPVPPIPAAGTVIAGAPPPLAPVDEPWVTRSDGTYRAYPASPGRVRVLVHHPQYIDAVSDTVSLAPGGTVKLDVVMRAGGTLEGRVLDAGGKPVEGSRVVLAAARGGLERVARTASDGTFGFAAVPADVVLLVSPDDDGSPVEMRAQVSVPEGGKRSVTLQLPVARDPLPVLVRDDRGYPVATAQVTVMSLDPTSALRETVFTDAQGEAKLPRAKGLALRAEVSAPGHAPATVRADPTAATLSIALAPGESASGLVRSTRGDPIADAEVVLYTELGARRTRTEANGVFTISDLAPGSARLAVHATGFARVTRDVSIDPNGGRRATTFDRTELARGGAVEGVVLDARGDPIAGARVAEGLVPTYLAVGSSPSGVAVTDARGRFHLADLPEGTVGLEAYAADVGRAHVDVRVAAGETTRDVRFSLVAEGGSGSHEPAAAGSLAVTLGETNAPAEVVIVAVAEGSEAERAGVAPGDAVVSVGGEPVTTMAEARAKMSGPLGDDVLLTLRRQAGVETLRVPREPVRR